MQAEHAHQRTLLSHEVADVRGQALQLEERHRQAEGARKVRRGDWERE